MIKFSTEHGILPDLADEKYDGELIEGLKHG